MINEEYLSDDYKHGVITSGTLIEPARPQWLLHINGSTRLEILKENAPNAFHRFMQKLILGFKWEKLDNDYEI